MATQDEIDTTVEAIGDYLEDMISTKRDGAFLFSQHDAIDVLHGAWRWCRDRIAGIREEIGDD